MLVVLNYLVQICSLRFLAPESRPELRALIFKNLQYKVDGFESCITPVNLVSIFMSEGIISFFSYFLNFTVNKPFLFSRKHTVFSYLYNYNILLVFVATPQSKKKEISIEISRNSYEDH